MPLRAISLFAISVITGIISANEVKADPLWTGPYAGVHAGYSWGDTTVKDDAKDGVPPGPFSYTTGGFVGGGTAGYNLQLDGIVLGIEGDIGYMDLSGSGIIGSSKADHHQNITTDGGLYGDITGRAGVLVTPAVLLYGKGGFAFYNGEAAQATTADGFVTHGTDTFTGWVAGGGIEYAISTELSFKVEYLHFDFGTQGGDQTSVTDDPIGHVYHNTHSLDADTVKLGINYHF